MIEDVEDVYPGVTFDGKGQVKEDPIHVFIPKLIPIHMDIHIRYLHRHYICRLLAPRVHLRVVGLEQ